MAYSATSDPWVDRCADTPWARPPESDPRHARARRVPRHAV